MINFARQILALLTWICVSNARRPYTAYINECAFFDKSYGDYISIYIQLEGGFVNGSIFSYLTSLRQYRENENFINLFHDDMKTPALRLRLVLTKKEEAKQVIYATTDRLSIKNVYSRDAFDGPFGKSNEASHASFESNLPTFNITLENSEHDLKLKVNGLQLGSYELGQSDTGKQAFLHIHGDLRLRGLCFFSPENVIKQDSEPTTLAPPGVDYETLNGRRPFPAYMDECVYFGQSYEDIISAYAELEGGFEIGSSLSYITALRRNGNNLNLIELLNTDKSEAPVLRLRVVLSQQGGAKLMILTAFDAFVYKKIFGLDNVAGPFGRTDNAISFKAELPTFNITFENSGLDIKVKVNNQYIDSFDIAKLFLGKQAFVHFYGDLKLRGLCFYSPRRSLLDQNEEFIVVK